MGEKDFVDLRCRPPYLIEVMGECRCIVINVLHHNCDVSLSLVLAVCGSDSQGVPRLFLEV